MHVINVIAMVTGHFYRIVAVVQVIDVLAMVMQVLDIVIGLKL